MIDIMKNDCNFMRNGRPSKTAYKVAMSIVTLGARPEMNAILPSGIVQATEELLVACGVISPGMLPFIRSPWSVSAHRAFDWMLPGQFEAFGHRKAFCEKQVRDGIHAGATQILVLGAGYDTLGWRLAPEFPSVQFFEIDHPATAHLKAKGIEVMGLRSNLHLIPEDLGERRLADTLKSDDSWKSSAQTVILAEGLVMYLYEDAVRDLFHQCVAVTGPCSRIVFSYIPSGAGGKPNVGQWTDLMLWFQKISGEPWNWSIHNEKLDLFLIETGWTRSPEEQNATIPKHGFEIFVLARKTKKDAEYEKMI